MPYTLKHTHTHTHKQLQIRSNSAKVIEAIFKLQMYIIRKHLVEPIIP